MTAGIGLGFGTCCGRDCTIFGDDFDALPGPGLGDDWTVESGSAVIQAAPAPLTGQEMAIAAGGRVSPAASHPAVTAKQTGTAAARCFLEVGTAVRVVAGHATGPTTYARLLRLPDVESGVGITRTVQRYVELSIVHPEIIQPARTLTAGSPLANPTASQLQWMDTGLATCLSSVGLFVGANSATTTASGRRMSQLLAVPPTGPKVAVEAEGGTVRLANFAWSETPDTLPSGSCPVCTPDCNVCPDTKGPLTSTVRFTGWPDQFLPPGFGGFVVCGFSVLDASFVLPSIGGCRWSNVFPMVDAASCIDMTVEITLDISGVNLSATPGAPYLTVIVRGYSVHPLWGPLFFQCSHIWYATTPLSDCAATDQEVPHRSGSCVSPAVDPPRAWVTL